MTTVLCVPQWQGSASSKAPRLVAGARRAARLVPADAVVTVPVLETGGERADGIRALDVLVANQRLTQRALDGIDDDRVITVGGDCSVDIAPIAAARARYGDALRVLWIDAHPDVYSPQTLPSGAFHGMVVRALLGDGPAGLTPKSRSRHNRWSSPGSGHTSHPSTSTWRRPACAGTASTTWSGLSTVCVARLRARRPRRVGTDGLRLHLLPGTERRPATATDRPGLPDRRHRRRRHHRARAGRRRGRRRRGRGDPPVGRRTDALTGRSTGFGGPVGTIDGRREGS
ncbi:arginase family protein [Micromonospora sp. M12]